MIRDLRLRLGRLILHWCLSWSLSYQVALLGRSRNRTRYLACLGPYLNCPIHQCFRWCCLGSWRLHSYHLRPRRWRYCSCSRLQMDSRPRSEARGMMASFVVSLGVVSWRSRWSCRPRRRGNCRHNQIHLVRSCHSYRHLVLSYALSCCLFVGFLGMYFRGRWQDWLMTM